MLRLVEEHGTRYWALIGNDLLFLFDQVFLNMKVITISSLSYDYPTVKGAKLNGRTGKQVCKN